MLLLLLLLVRFSFSARWLKYNFGARTANTCVVRPQCNRTQPPTLSGTAKAQFSTAGKVSVGLASRWWWVLSTPTRLNIWLNGDDHSVSVRNTAHYTLYHVIGTPTPNWRDKLATVVSHQFITLSVHLSWYTCCSRRVAAKFSSKSRVGNKVLKKYPYFWKYTNSLATHCGISRGKPLRQTSSICWAISVQHRLVTDGRTDRRTQGHG